jgi:hypothetical protein
MAVSARLQNSGRRYNAIVIGLAISEFSRQAGLKLACVLAAAVLLAGCNRAPQNEEAVRSGIIEHLSKNSGLDLNSMDVDVTSVSFNASEAKATVAFRPKGSPDQGMSMNYTLERRGGNWVVKGRAGGGTPHGGTGAPTQQPGGSDLPPGHPPVGGSDSSRPATK